MLSPAAEREPLHTRRIRVDAWRGGDTTRVLHTRWHDSDAE